jgi:hypothetical protein
MTVQSDANMVIYTCINSFLPQDSHAVLDTVHSIRDLGEVIFPQLLVFLMESAVVAPNKLQAVTAPDIES